MTNSTPGKQPQGQCDVCFQAFPKEEIEKHKRQDHARRSYRIERHGTTTILLKTSQPKPGTAKTHGIVQCPVCGSPVRIDHLGRHELEMHPAVASEGHILSQVKPVRIRRSEANYSPIILNDLRGAKEKASTRPCDECGRTRVPLTRFPKSNRNYSVLLCGACLETVKNRSITYLKQRGQRIKGTRVSVNRRKQKRRRKQVVFQVIYTGGFEVNAQRH